MDTGRIMKIPGPDHPITITPNPRRVRVIAGGKVIADTTSALALKEATYPVVNYIPRECRGSEIRTIICRESDVRISEP